MKKENRTYLILALLLLSLLLIPLASTQTVLLAEENERPAENKPVEDAEAEDGLDEIKEEVGEEGGTSDETEDCVKLIVYKKISDLPALPPQVFSIDPSLDEPPEPLKFEFILVPVKEDGSLDLDNLDDNLDKALSLVVTADKPASICVPRGKYRIFEVITNSKYDNGGYTFVEFYFKGQKTCEEQYPGCEKGKLYCDKNEHDKYTRCINNHRLNVRIKAANQLYINHGFFLDLTNNQEPVELIVYNRTTRQDPSLIGISVQKKWTAAEGLILPEKREVKLELFKNHYELIDGEPTLKQDVKVERFALNGSESWHPWIDEDDFLLGYKIDPDPLVLPKSNGKEWEHRYSLTDENELPNYNCFYRYDTTGREIDYFFKELNTPPGFIFKELEKFFDEDWYQWNFTYENYYAGLGTITVKKELKGSTIDQDRIFNFRLSAKKEDLITGPKDQDYLLEFSLKGGEEKVIQDLELGTYTLEELNPGEYDVTYQPAQTVTINEESKGEREVTISVINHLPETTPTTTFPKTTLTIRPSETEPEETVVQPKTSLPATGEMPSMDVRFLAALGLIAALLFFVKKKS